MASRTLFKVAPSLTYNGSNDKKPGTTNGADAQWSISLGCTAARILSDRQDGASRRDWYLEPLLTATFIPPLRWFDGEEELTRKQRYESLGAPSLTLQVAYTRLTSNMAAVEFEQWQVGPAFVVQWQF